MNRSLDQQRAYDDWRRRAAQADILAEAIKRGAKLKRAGREWVGPCIACKGVDRFSVNPSKRIFNCRGAIGGDVITMIQHIDGVSFSQACEALTQEPAPNGHSRPLSDAAREAIARRHAQNERAQRQREAQQEQYQADTKEAAQAIWDASGPLSGLAETYLLKRGIQIHPWPDVLRFHSALPYPGKGRHPALVARVDDLSGGLTAVWRIFLGADGDKLRCDNPKLGLGPAGGGAVRLGGLGPKLALAEGIETAMGYWLLTGRKYPCWATLSTAGLRGIELPLGVRSVCVVPDGDSPMKRNGSEYVPAIPPGRDAAHSLRVRLLGQGVDCTIAPEPKSGTDYLDVWRAHAREIA